MSIAAALGNMGLALRDINNEQRAQQIQDEEIAARREERKQTGQLRGLQISEAMSVAADRQKQRGWDASYEQAAKGAPDEETTLRNTMKAAQTNGDTKTLMATRQQIAALKAGQLKQAVDGGLRQLMGTGDPTGLQTAYNNLFPDGNKVNVERTPDNKYNLQFVDASGKVTGQQPGMTVDQIGMAAMKLMDPKFAQQVWMDQMKDDREIKKETTKGEIKLNHDKTLESYKADRAYDLEDMRGTREAANIGLRGAEERRTGAANAAAHGMQSRLTNADKAKLDGGGDGSMDALTLDKRVQKGRQSLDKYFGISALSGIDPKSQPAYLMATEKMGVLIRNGIDPEAAAVQAVREADATAKANAISPGAKSQPQRPAMQLPAYQ